LAQSTNISLNAVTPSVIFIDKFNVSGIETIILDLPVQEITHLPAAYRPDSASAATFDFHCRVLAAT
jgi:hypothetical protein